MGLTEDHSCRSLEFAKRFLQTAVVVDDKAYMSADRSGGPKGQVVAPDRRAQTSSQHDQGSVGRRSTHTLDAGSIIDSFSALGVICSVVGPTGSAMGVMRKADIVILDWLLKEDDPQHALGLLGELLAGEADRNSLRLVAIYTGEARLATIYKSVFIQLEKAGLDPDDDDGGETTIPYRHGRVVLYAKSDVNLPGPLKERSVAEGKLPERLVRDFADMTEGLLPSIALASLTAVREGAHRVLDQFCANLDPAFLAHRACLPNPDDAERQIVNHVAEELRGLMDNAVAEQSPAGDEEVEAWVRRNGGDATSIKFGRKKLNLDQTVTLATKGLETSKLGNSSFEGLSAGFAEIAGNFVNGSDERLAWIMSFRTVRNEPPPTLWLGSVVTEIGTGNEKHLICIRPRCDCVRLDKATSFFFLPLVEPRKVKEQLVVKLGRDFKRFGISLDPAGWEHRIFQPSAGKRAVVATPQGSGSCFDFVDTDSQHYTWQGELKAEYAQRIAQTFATTLSRVAVDESEWLRRMAGTGR